MVATTLVNAPYATLAELVLEERVVLPVMLSTLTPRAYAPNASMTWGEC